MDAAINCAWVRSEEFNVMGKQMNGTAGWNDRKTTEI
jgi:hypothetical protein